MHWPQMATIFQFQSWVYTKSCHGEKSGFKVSFLFKWDGGGSGGVNSSLIHLTLYSFSQESVFLHMLLVSSQLREAGCEELSWGPFQQEGPGILSQALVSLGQLCLLLIKSCQSHERCLGALCGGGFLKSCLLARLTAHAVFPRQGLGQGKGWNKEQCVGFQKTLQDGGVMGGGSGKTFPFSCFKVCWSFRLIICLSILKISIYFHDIYQKQAPDYTTKLTLTLPYCY